MVPLWVKRQYWKYEADSSLTNEENIDPKTYTEIPSADGREQVSENDDDESLNCDPTARRCDSDFYQNIEDRCHFRDENEPDIEPEGMAQVINISNPAGHNFMELAKDRPLQSLLKFAGD